MGFICPIDLTGASAKGSGVACTILANNWGRQHIQVQEGSKHRHGKLSSLLQAWLQVPLHHEYQ